ncbi:hypothetical protein [Bauldia sp.]|uniref:hypothetical protein n=1 Tax=Bauldia sp. TaxID=2575872 RepID=UPI003BAB20C8
MRRIAIASAMLAGLLGSMALAGEADVIEAVATPEAGGTWRFDVTVRHADEGWDHYADAWEVRLPDGTVLGTRTLLHPHENEQPFTRSLRGVAIPDDAETVEVYARDSVHGWGGAVVTVILEAPPS